MANEDTDTQREEGLVKMDAEIGVMALQVQENQGVSST